VARNTDEIKAEIEATRRVIESRLDQKQEQLSRLWWVPIALVGAFAFGFLLARPRTRQALRTTARTVGGTADVAFTGLTVAQAARHVNKALRNRQLAAA
jgi:hypothetical protein